MIQKQNFHSVNEKIISILYITFKVFFKSKINMKNWNNRDRTISFKINLLKIQIMKTTNENYSD